MQLIHFGAELFESCYSGKHLQFWFVNKKSFDMQAIHFELTILQFCYAGITF